MTRKQEENIIKKIAKEITKEFPELKTKYDDIDDIGVFMILVYLS